VYVVETLFDSQQVHEIMNFSLPQGPDGLRGLPHHSDPSLVGSRALYLVVKLAERECKLMFIIIPTYAQISSVKLILKLLQKIIHVCEYSCPLLLRMHGVIPLAPHKSSRLCFDSDVRKCF